MPRRADADPLDAGAGSLAPKDHPSVAFPEADWTWLCERLTGLELPVSVAPRPIIERLYGHLVGVNRWLNLTKLTTPRDFLKLHILDSLVALTDVRVRHLAEGTPCVDLGSGGGYPGLPLALNTPRVPWFLMDARRKKADFLSQAGSLTGNPACTGLHLRGIDAAQDPRVFRRVQLVTCRAMADTVTCMREAAPLLRRHGHLLVWKGPAYFSDERQAVVDAAASYGWRLVAERRLQLESNDPDRVLVVLERLN